MQYHLAHQFRSDFLKLRFTDEANPPPLLGKVVHVESASTVDSVAEDSEAPSEEFRAASNFWRSLTYALLAAASDVIDINRTELDGLFRPVEVNFNAAELIIVVLAVRQGGELIDVARYSIIGSVIGNVLLILGASLLVSGIKNGRQGFSAAIAGVNATMLLLATVALALPTLFNGLSHMDTGATVNLSHGVAIVMVILYAAYLFHAFQSPEESGAATGHARWSTRLALAVLAVSAIISGVLSEFLVSAIEPTIEQTGISPVFIGLIVVPLVGNIAEHFAAVKIAAKGDLDFSMGIAFNSALQVALAVTAVAVLAGFVFGHELALAFGALEIAVLIAAAVVAAFIAISGKATWLEGLELLAIYAIAAIAFWYV